MLWSLRVINTALLEWLVPVHGVVWWWWWCNANKRRWVSWWWYRTGPLSTMVLFYRNYMNDALRTGVFVRFEPETIACIYLAARTLQVSTHITTSCLQAPPTVIDFPFFSSVCVRLGVSCCSWTFLFKQAVYNVGVFSIWWFLHLLFWVAAGCFMSRWYECVTTRKPDGSESH